MAGTTAGPAIAPVLFAATIVTTSTGIFVTIYFLINDPDFAYMVAATVLVGIAGGLSILRHPGVLPVRPGTNGVGTRPFRSSSLRSGYANLAIGLVAFAAAGLDLGPRRMRDESSYRWYRPALCPPPPCQPSDLRRGNQGACHKERHQYCIFCSSALVIRIYRSRRGQCSPVLNRSVWSGYLRGNGQPKKPKVRQYPGIKKPGQ